jgi:hypothetical protein
MVKNIKTTKNWVVTDLITEFSSPDKSIPDIYKVRLSNGAGKSQNITVKSLLKNYKW